MNSEKLRVVIVDDEPLARRHLERLLKAHPDVVLIASCRNAREAQQVLRETEPDAMFLDIEMPGQSGMELANLIRRRDIAVVFVTAHSEHAASAFDLEAVDYVLKPFLADRLARALKRLREALPRKVDQSSPVSKTDRIPVEIAGRVQLVSADAIDWIEADGKRVLLHTESQVLPLRQTMKMLEERLDGSRFIRVHRGAIVRTAAIEQMWPGFHGDWVIRLRGGAELLLSRRYRHRLDFLRTL
jgi:two-component system LytT family response regulator